MKVQFGPTIAAVPATPAKAPASLQGLPLGGPAGSVGANLAFLQGQRVHGFNPAAAGLGPSHDRVMGGVRALSDLVTPQFGWKVDAAVKGIWLAVDAAGAVGTLRDPASTKGDKVIALADLAPDALAVLGAVVSSPGLDQASTTVTIATLIGDKMHSGQLTFTQSELASLSNQPQSDEVSNILKIAEVFQP